jgi:sulfatase modifying factor 1
MRLALGLCLVTIVAGCRGRPLVPGPADPAAKGGPPDDSAPVPALVNQAMDAGEEHPAPLADAEVAADVTTSDASDTAPLVDAPPHDAAVPTDTTPPTDAPSSDGAPAGDTPPSCAGQGPGVATCGPDHDSCCTSLLVPGGTFYRSYDGVSCPNAGHEVNPIPFLGCYETKDAPATVSSFRLDKYMVTIGRFRRFVDAVVAGWTPAASDGRHEHLNDGEGLVDLGHPGAFEAGWDPAWTARLPRTRDDWDNHTYASWTGPPAADDDRPVGALLWAEAYAFCIWDGGFLPTEAEWNYAAAGGDEQRVYPWSSPPTSTTVDCAHAAFTGSLDCPSPNDLLPVGARSPVGDGRWGHADLVGLMDQWGLDWLVDYVTPAVDGAQLQMLVPSPIVTEPVRVLRGLTDHGWADSPPYLVAGRDGDTPWDTYTSVSGARCARAPLPASP